MRTATAALACVAAVLTAPLASAEPTTVTPPEIPPTPGEVFTNDPSILDPHSMPVESWSRVGAAGDVLALHFWTGTPECYGVDASVHETPETITVELRGGTRPDAMGRACIAIAVSGTLEVPLASPIGDRQVLSVY
jgi:hypothetical protein